MQRRARPPDDRTGRLRQAGGAEPGQGGVTGQHIVRQLGRGRLEDDPGGNEPGQGEPDAGLRPPAPGDNRCGWKQKGGREGKDRRGEGVHARRRAVALVTTGELGRQVAPDRHRPEGAIRGDGHRPGPGPDDRSEEDQAPGPADGPHRQGLAVRKTQGEGGETCDQRGDGPLDQHRQGEGRPEDGSRKAACRRTPPRLGIKARQRRHGQHGQAGQHGVRLGDEGLGGQEQAAAEQQSRQEGCASAEEAGGAPDAGRRRKHGAQQGRDPVKPNVPLSGVSEGRNGGRLHPVDAYGLLEPRLVLETDDHIVILLQHL